MECIVLAAGEGKRMRPLTANRPKVMLPIANRPMMEHLVVAARDAGIRDFIFVVGYKERMIRSYFGDGSPLGIRIRYVTQRRQLGTANALRSTAGLVEGKFLMLNGDMILNVHDISALARMEPPCMSIYPVEHPESYGVVTEEGGFITSLEEKSPHPRSNLINAGAYVFDPGIFRLLDEVSLSGRGEYELTDALSVSLHEHTLRSFRLSFWLDVGHPWDMLEANASLLASLPSERQGTVEEGVTLQGDISIGERSVIKAGTYIEGPCVIGKNCRIGPHAYIRGATSIGDDCHIGHSTEIKNSIVMSGTKIPHFNYIGDSIIGSGCNFGAGTKIANLRHDHKPVKVCGTSSGRVKFGAIVGDEVQFGINCSVNVGAVVGSNSIIAPHSLIEGCIENGTVIR
jgi:UDP-N-acetylglucosamine diphosphorylase / glucose-1-phosphate thymidylyltransferase / UDP-N-acetylgalactosamine diphosphorylase / glucosamine-1-phosphate N-acetyltransferase / galactosamine-1-phosphate N-acetyltransferase